jgi:hypothetical protein
MCVDPSYAVEDKGAQVEEGSWDRRVETRAIEFPEMTQ